MDGVEHSRSRAPHAMTEINFGLRSAGNGRLARHGRPGQGATYLRTAIFLNLHQPAASSVHRKATDTLAPQGLSRAQRGLQPARSPRQATDTLAPQGLSRAQRGLQPARSPRQATDTIAPQGLSRCQGGLQPARSPRQATDTIAPQGLPRAQRGLQPARSLENVLLTETSRQTRSDA